LTKTHHKWILLATVLLFSAIVPPSVSFAEQSGADSAIASAKQQIVTCYNAAKAAEAAGANITSLTSILNDAGTLLSQSELAYSKSDSSTAQNLAVQSSQSLANFLSEANAMQDAAAQQRTTEFLVNVVGSIIGTIAVIVAGFVVWRFLRKRQPQTGEQTDEPAGL
jgi:hypothetical protein